MVRVRPSRVALVALVLAAAATLVYFQWEQVPISVPVVRVKSLRPLSFQYHMDDYDRESLIEQRYEQLQDLMKQHIGLPKVSNLVMGPSEDDVDSYERANATMLILAKNSDIRQVLSTIGDIERHFNGKFHYPYVFINDQPFTKRFIRKVEAILPNRELYFEEIAADVWNPPSHVSMSKTRDGMQELKDLGIAYADKMSYHNMCRFYSINFYNHPRLQQFRYYWRFEPQTEYFCDIDYDVFKFMESNNKVYGFTISLYDSEQTVKSLWPVTMDFLKENPQYLHENAAIDFLLEDMMHPEKTKYTGGYSTCHFWSNFEIADMDFYRGEAYSKWAEELEKAGGFYYERWGDAPVHSIGVGLFADKSQIHWFRDIGYKHHPYTNSPNSDKCPGKYQPGDFTYDHLKDQNCLSNWWLYEMTENERRLY